MNIRQIGNLVGFIVTVVVNALANTLPINGQTTGEVSDSFPVLFTPAGYVFAVWGLIYLLLAGFVVYQALPAQKNNPRLERLGYWFVASNVFNSAWIFFWHYELFGLTMLAMFGLLVSLVMAYLRLGIGAERFGTQEKLFVALPFSIYFGWISVATVANASVFLYDLGWNGGSLGPIPWTVVMILIAAILGIAMIALRREIAYPLVMVWAFVGIAVRQSGTMAVLVTAVLAAIILAVVLGLAWVRRTNLAVKPA